MDKIHHLIDVIDMDYVVIAGVQVQRPSWFSRSRWLNFWKYDEHLHTYSRRR